MTRHRLLRRSSLAALSMVVVTAGLTLTDAPPATAASLPRSWEDSVLVNQSLPLAVAPKMPRTLIITDSTGASIRWEAKTSPTYEQFDILRRAGGSWEFRGESCRAVSLLSCRGREGYGPPNVLDELATIPVGTIDELTIMAGYNEGAEPLNTGIQKVLDLARSKGIKHVSWLNFCECSTYVGPAFMQNATGTYGTRNTYLIQRATQSDGYLSIIDWGSINASDASLTAADHSHLTARGAVRVARLMAESIVGIWLGDAAGPASKAANLLAHPQTDPVEGRFTGLTPPRRLLDTRNGVSGSGLPQLVLAGEAIRIPVDVAGATAAVVNATVVQPDEAGFLTAYPCTAEVPTASFSNFTPGTDTANTTNVKLDADGGFCLYSSATTHLVVDLYGTLSSTGDGFIPSAPTRIFDSRTKRTKVATTVAIAVGATSLHGNVTVANGTIGFATAWPGTGDGTCPQQPNTSLVNWSSSAAVANRIDLSLPAGELCIAVSTPADVIVDSFGRYAPGGHAVASNAPTRLFDSRRGSGAAKRFAIPITSSSAFVNVDLVTIGSASGYTTIWSAPACGEAPNTSLANQAAGVAKANSVQLPNNGTICVFADTPIELILDLV